MNSWQANNRSSVPCVLRFHQVHDESALKHLPTFRTKYVIILVRAFLMCVIFYFALASSNFHFRGNCIEYTSGVSFHDF